MNSEQTERHAQYVALSSAMCHEESLDKALQRLDESMFSYTPHRLLFEALKEVRVADPPMVLNWIAENGYLDEIGGTSDFWDLVWTIADPYNIDYHLDLVAEHSRKRNLRKLGADVARDDGASADELTDKITKALESSPSADTGIVDPDDLAGRVITRLVEGPEDRWGQPLGLGPFDNHYSAKCGRVTFWTGAPSSGKSLVTDLGILTLIQQEWKVAILSAEVDDDEHVEALLHSALGRDPRSRSDGVDRWLSALMRYIRWLDLTRPTLSTILARAKAAARQLKGLDLLLIDPWNKIRHPREEYAREDLYLEEALSQITAAAKQMDIAIWVVAHPTKLQLEEGCRHRVRPPTARDIYGGSQWWNQGDAIITLHRDHMGEKDDPTVVTLATEKIKQDGHWGHMGRSCRLKFRPETRRLYPVDEQMGQKEFGDHDGF